MSTGHKLVVPNDTQNLFSFFKKLNVRYTKKQNLHNIIVPSKNRPSKFPNKTITWNKESYDVAGVTTASKG